MSSTKATARLAGALYLAFSLLAIFGYMYVPATLVVAGDAAATARRITEGELMYRLGIFASLAGMLTFIFLALALYQLFEDVDRNQARLLVALVCVGAAAEIVNLANRAAPLMLLGGADFLSVFTRGQLEALALGFIRLGNILSQFTTSFWGLWLFPFGVLVIRSGYFPKFLGILLFAAGFAYAATCAVRVVFPAQFGAVSPFLTPLYVAELPIIFWLIMGGRTPQAKAQPAHAV